MIGILHIVIYIHIDFSLQDEIFDGCDDQLPKNMNKVRLIIVSVINDLFLACQHFCHVKKGC